MSAYVTAILQNGWPLTPSSVGRSFSFLVISKVNTLDQPFQEPLLGDGLAPDLSTIGDKELGCAVMSEVAGVFHILIECPMDTRAYVVHHLSGCALLAQRKAETRWPW